MVSPKHKAMNIDSKDLVIDAINEIGKLRPNKSKIMFLIDEFNKAHGTDIFTWGKFAGVMSVFRGLPDNA